MDLWDIGRLLLRRWFVFIPLMLVTLVATLQTSQYVKPEFTATGSVLLVPPTGKPAPVPAGKPAPPGNPWADLGPVSMALAVTIIQESQGNREAAAQAGWEPGYTLNIVTRSAIITVTVTSKSPAKAKGTVRYVIDQLNREVSGKQQDFEHQPTLKVTTELLDGAGTVTAVTTGVRRAQIAIAGIGAILAIVLTIIIDALIKMLRRRRERTVRAAVRGVAAATPPQPTPPQAVSLLPPPPQFRPVTTDDAKRELSITSADTMVLHVIRSGDEPTVPRQ